MNNIDAIQKLPKDLVVFENNGHVLGKREHTIYGKININTFRPSEILISYWPAESKIGTEYKRTKKNKHFQDGNISMSDPNNLQIFLYTVRL